MPDPGASAEVVVGSTPSSQEASDWALALTASGVRSRAIQEGTRWLVVVEAAEEDRAKSILEAYASDSRQSSEDAVAPLEYGSTNAAFAISLALVLFHVYLSRYDPDQLWFWRGNASAERILRGEMWRTVTALTLHADVVHVVTNAVFFALFGSALFRAIGPGLGLWALLLSGAGGNLLDAAWRGAPNISVGASTAIFGAVGTLGGMRFMNRYRIVASRRRSWVALAATLALLAMLGTAPGSDVLAHLFGAAVGVALGMAIAARLQRTPGIRFQALLFLSALALVAGAWMIALLHAF